jgi:hypothetical protein
MKQIIALVLLLGFAAAQPAQADSLQPKIYSGIEYLSGGIGELEREALKEIADNYSLKLVFASDVDGAYLADVRVEIQDARGEPVLQTVAQGPWLFVRLPQGKYRVEAIHEGRPMQQTLTVPASGQREVVLRWPPLKPVPR